MEPKKEGWDKWGELEKLKINLLKTIYIQGRVNATFTVDIWKSVFKKTDADVVKRMAELDAIVKAQLEEYLFAQHGSIDYKSMFPETDNPPQ